MIQQTGATPGGSAQRLASAEARLSQSPTGAQIMATLDAHHVRIDVLSDADYRARFADGSGAFFDAKTKSITAPAGSFDSPDEGAIMLAHEGTHAVDYFAGHGLAGSAGSVLRSLATGIIGAPFHMKNPASAAVDALRSTVNDDETVAYRTQAIVEDELHIRSARVSDFGHDDAGALRTPAATKQAIESASLYQLRGGLRMVFATLSATIIGIGAVGTAAFGVRKLTGAALPNWARWGAMGALAGAMVLDDSLRQRSS